MPEVVLNIGVIVRNMFSSVRTLLHSYVIPKYLFAIVALKTKTKISFVHITAFAPPRANLTKLETPLCFSSLSLQKTQEGSFSQV